MKIIGKNKKEISIYCLDVYSILHVFWGNLGVLLIYFLGFFFLNTSIGKIIMNQSSFITFVSAVLWELIENNIIILKSKLKNIQDSLNNSLFDIICIFFGIMIGEGTFIFFFDKIILFMFISLILFIIELSFFFIIHHIYYTQN